MLESDSDHRAFHHSTQSFLGVRRKACESVTKEGMQGGRGRLDQLSTEPSVPSVLKIERDN